MYGEVRDASLKSPGYSTTGRHKQSVDKEGTLHLATHNRSKVNHKDGKQSEQGYSPRAKERRARDETARTLGCAHDAPLPCVPVVDVVGRTPVVVALGGVTELAAGRATPLYLARMMFAACSARP